MTGVSRSANGAPGARARAGARFAGWLGEGGAPVAAAAADAGLPALCWPRGPEKPCRPHPEDCLAPPRLAPALRVRGCGARGVTRATKASVARGEVARAVGTSSKGDADLEPDIPGADYTAFLKEQAKMS